MDFNDQLAEMISLQYHGNTLLEHLIASQSHTNEILQKLCDIIENKKEILNHSTSRSPLHKNPNENVTKDVIDISDDEGKQEKFSKRYIQGMIGSRMDLLINKNISDILKESITIDALKSGKRKDYQKEIQLINNIMLKIRDDYFCPKLIVARENYDHEAFKDKNSTELNKIVEIVSWKLSSVLQDNGALGVSPNDIATKFRSNFLSAINYAYKLQNNSKSSSNSSQQQAIDPLSEEEQLEEQEVVIERGKSHKSSKDHASSIDSSKSLALRSCILSSTKKFQNVNENYSSKSGDQIPWLSPSSDVGRSPLQGWSNQTRRNHNFSDPETQGSELQEEEEEQEEQQLYYPTPGNIIVTSNQLIL
jgi:hypothetical protein